MKPIILVGVITVQLAMIFYTIFIINENKKKSATKMVLLSLTLAVFFDLFATSCMMIGTTKTFFTFHGILGYIGLLAMIIDAILVWRHKIKLGAEQVFSRTLNLYSKIAYVWWIIAFMTGVAVTISSRG